jgi:hypothetical protein
VTTQSDRARAAMSVTRRDNASVTARAGQPPTPGHSVTALGQLTAGQREREESLALGHPEWMRPPGYSRYEASRHSLWRRGEDGKPVLVSGGIRNEKGLLLRPRVGNRGYLLINLIDDEGVKRTLTVHKVILLAHAGEPGPGEEALHENGDAFDCRFPLNLYWGTHELNVRQRVMSERRRNLRGWRKVAAWLRRLGHRS